jgi:IS5 family transposase
VLRKAIRKQINYLKRDVLIINKMLGTIKDEPVPFERRQQKYFFVIRHLLEQQETMYRKKSHQVEDRIVSIHQPHVRPIVRGKAKAKTEFGAKINISLLDGYARVDHFHWDAFNEGQDLQGQVERFRKLSIMISCFVYMLIICLERIESIYGCKWYTFRLEYGVLFN